MQVFLQVKENLFYMIETGKVTTLNTREKTKTSGLSFAKSLPTAYVENVKVIPEIEFRKVLYNFISNNVIGIMNTFESDKTEIQFKNGYKTNIPKLYKVHKKEDFSKYLVDLSTNGLILTLSLL